MALPNFISPPTVGQQQTINGTTYEWDGTKWFVIQATRAVDHNATTNRNAVGAHDDIYSRKINSISELTTTLVNKTDGVTVGVLNYHVGIAGGGGKFKWIASEPKSNHNGGTVIDPTKAFPSDWSNQVDLNNWFNVVNNTGSGCWVRVSQDVLKFNQFGVVNDGDSATPTNNRIAFSKAIQVADGRLVEGAGNHCYGIDQPSRPAVRLPSNTNIDMHGGKLRKLPSSVNKDPFLENETNSENITIKNVHIQGVGADNFVSDQGSAILLFDNDGAWLENITTDQTEGDGLQFRRAENTFVINCEVRNFGRNAISPTSGSFFIDGLRTTGSPYVGANPGIYFDAENDSSTETTVFYIVNSQIKNMTFVDFYNSGGGKFNHTLHMSNTKIGPSFNPFRLLNKSGVNSESMDINLDSTVTIEASNGSAIQVEGVNNGRLKGVRLIASDNANSKIGVSFVGALSGWEIDCNTETQYNFAEDVLLIANQTNMTIRGKYRRVQLQGTSVANFVNASIGNLTLNNTNCSAKFSIDSGYDGLSLLSGASDSQLSRIAIKRGIRQEGVLSHEFVSNTSFVDHSIGTVDFLTNGNESFGASIKARASSNNTGRLIFQSSFGAARSDRWQVAEKGDFEPLSDNTFNLGSAINRVKEIFSANGTINTSDERLKTPIESISEQEKLCALEIKANYGKFKWLDSVEREIDGGKKARIHFGVGAQTVGEIFKKHNLNPDDYSVFCHDAWVDEFDAEGNLILKAGDKYGVRLEQLNAFIISGL